MYTRLIEKKVSEEAVNRVWGDGGFRVFLSHLSEFKNETVGLKNALAKYGVSCFVAHEDIIPNEEWLKEIENALSSMDALVALMTDGFHKSKWTDQEIGIACGMSIPVYTVKMGEEPYGFIAKFQAITSDWDNVAIGLLESLMKNGKMVDAYIDSLSECSSYSRGNALADCLSFINKLSPTQAEKLVDAYHSNSELRGSFGFSGAGNYPGLVNFLNELSPDKYEWQGDGRRYIQKVSS